MGFAARIAPCLWAVALFTGTAFADALIPPPGGFAPCEQASLESYLSSPGCAIGPFYLGNFGWATPTGNAPRLAQPSELELTFNWSEDTRQLQIRLGGFDCTLVSGAGERCFDVGDGQSATYGFEMTVDPGPILDGMETSFDPPFGLLAGGLLYCVEGFLPDCSNQGAASFFFRNNESEPAVLSFRSPVSILDTSATFTLNPGPGSTPSGFDGLLYTVQAVPSQVPEPGTLALLGVGLVAVRAVSRRRRR